jgi:hypothetical protein
MTLKMKTAALCTIALVIMVALTYVNAQNIRGNGASRNVFAAKHASVESSQFRTASLLVST